MAACAAATTCNTHSFCPAAQARRAHFHFDSLSAPQHRPWRTGAPLRTRARAACASQRTARVAHEHSVLCSHAASDAFVPPFETSHPVALVFEPPSDACRGTSLTSRQPARDRALFRLPLPPWLVRAVPFAVPSRCSLLLEIFSIAAPPTPHFQMGSQRGGPTPAPAAALARRAECWPAGQVLLPCWLCLQRLARWRT